MQESARKWRRQAGPITDAPPPAAFPPSVRAGIRARENLIRRLPKRAALSDVMAYPRSLTVAGAAQASGNQDHLILISSPVSRSTRRETSRAGTRYRLRAGGTYGERAFPHGPDCKQPPRAAQRVLRGAACSGRTRGRWGFPCRVRPLSGRAFPAPRQPRTGLRNAQERRTRPDHGIDAKQHSKLDVSS